ncbi:hypothetical protein Tco_1077874 [Tanacetum coccineum]
MDFDVIPSNDIGSDLNDSSPSEIVQDLTMLRRGYALKVESTSNSCTLSPVIDTLLPFSSENNDKVFNHGVLASKMSRIFEASHARGFCPSITRASSPQLHLGIHYPNLID